MNAAIAVDRVTRLAPNARRLVGFELETPQQGFQDEAHNLPFIGWVLPYEAPPIAMDVLFDGAIFARFSFGDQRPDVSDAFPSFPHAGLCSFRRAVSTLGLEDPFELILRVELPDAIRIPLFSIRGTRQRLPAERDSLLQPLILWNIGRSGSTWVTQLLGRHPEIVTYRPFEYEPRIASYWIEVVRRLAQPASYRNALDPEVHDEWWWLGRDRTTRLPSLDAERELHRVLEKDAIEELAAFGRGRVERFYRAVSQLQDKPTALYFLERFFGTDPMAATLAAELFAGAKEIFLVRDYRDVLCSIRSYNDKTGLSQFGRQPHDDEEAYIRGHFQSNVRALADRWKQRRDSALLLRYEDLMTEPRRTLTATLDFLGLDSGRETVDRTLDEALRDQADRQRQHMTTSDPRTSIGRWRQELSIDLQAACSEAFGDVLQEFGYDDA